MKVGTILFAITMFASTVLAQSGDPGAAARWRMKFGRDITRQSQVQVTKSAGNTDDSPTCSCCRQKHA